MSRRLALDVAMSTLAVVVAFAAGVEPAAADPRSRRCEAPVSASSSGLGVLGRGERRAYLKARDNWEDKVRSLYGDRYARFSTARNVVSNCKGGTLAPAKCTVTARPCRV